MYVIQNLLHTYIYSTYNQQTFRQHVDICPCCRLHLLSNEFISKPPTSVLHITPPLSPQLHSYPQHTKLVCQLNYFQNKMRWLVIIRLITCFSYVLMISLDHQDKMANYLIDWPFCSDNFIRSYEIIRSQKSR